MIPSKATLRKQLRGRREAMSEVEWQTRSDRLCQHLDRHLQGLGARVIFAYHACHREPDIQSLYASSPHCQWVFPRCVGKELFWHPWQAGDALVSGAYGILEPPADAPTIDPKRADVILVPAIACDRRGYRLGYGGGFYDRFLRTFGDGMTALTVGITFAFAFLPELPTDPWDLPLGAVCTEESIWTVDNP